METEVNKRKDEVFNEVVRRCEAFKAESFEQTKKFREELYKYIEEHNIEHNIMSSASLYDIKGDVMRDLQDEYDDGDLEYMTRMTQNLPYLIWGHFKWDTDQR